MADAPKRKGLGRGLAALIDDIRPEEAAPPRPAEAMAPIDRIRPNPNQPRRTFNEDDLESLTASIRAKGVVQPLVVRPDPDDPTAFQIVAGERRWRAAQRAQLHELPIVVRALDDAEVLEIAIIENVQRADLNPIEEAAGYAQLIEKFGHTQEQLATALGKSRSAIANALRLKSLPADVVELVRSGALSAGHARALVTAIDPSALAREVLRRDLSVRATEALAKAAKSPGEKPKPKEPVVDADTRALEADLSAATGLKIKIRHAGAGGELRISYRDLDQLDGLCQLLSRN